MLLKLGIIQNSAEKKAAQFDAEQHEKDSNYSKSNENLEID